MVTTIEACACNLPPEGRQALDEVPASVRIHPCLEHCGICHRGSFLVIDGTVFRGRDHRTIIEEARAE